MNGCVSLFSERSIFSRTVAINKLSNTWLMTLKLALFNYERACYCLRLRQQLRAHNIVSACAADLIARQKICDLWMFFTRWRLVRTHFSNAVYKNAKKSRKRRAGDSSPGDWQTTNRNSDGETSIATADALCSKILLPFTQNSLQMSKSLCFTTLFVHRVRALTIRGYWITRSSILPFDFGAFCAELWVDKSEVSNVS